MTMPQHTMLELPGTGIDIETSISAPPTYKYQGPFGYILHDNAAVAEWNTYARPTDLCELFVSMLYPNVAPFIANIKAGSLIRVLVDVVGAPPGTTNIDNDHLNAVDNLLQARNGPQVETLFYGDDNFGPLSASARIALMQSKVDFIRNYARANGAPSFQVVYVPASRFMKNNIVASPSIISYPDGSVYQAQPDEDTNIAGNPVFVQTVKKMFIQMRAIAPTHPCGVQLQPWSLSDPSNIYTLDRMVTDINAVGYYSQLDPILNWINIYNGNPVDPAAGTVAFNNIIHYYRP